MNRKLPVCLALIALALAPACRALADDVLFFGNSFTMGSGDRAASELGGVPKLVEAIATSKGKKMTTVLVGAGGKDWGFHLAQPKTDEALTSKKWDWVVLQDLSTMPTRLGNIEQHRKNGEAFYRRIREKSPGAKVELYETWAFAVGHPFITGQSTPKSFADPAEMTRELQKGYTDTQKDLEAIEPGEQVVTAPVGEAFERCREKYPELTLHAGDKKHASALGSYLAALTIYATISKDSPIGATREFKGLTINAADAKKLQEVATEVTGH